MKALVICALLLGAAPALAQTSGGAPAAKAKDPNRRICEVQDETGSRLRAKKICMTAREWDERRRLERQDLERGQQNSGTPKSG